MESSTERLTLHSRLGKLHLKFITICDVMFCGNRVTEILSSEDFEQRLVSGFLMIGKALWRLEFEEIVRKLKWESVLDRRLL